MCAGDVFLDSLVADYKAEAKNQGATPIDLQGINHVYVLEDLKNRCYINTTTYTGGEIHIYEGMRSVVLHIQTQLNYEKPEKESEE